MSDVLLLPKLAESLTEARIASWLVAVGATVEPGQAVAVVETDKFTMELEADRACVIEALLVSEGELAEMGTPIARIRPIQSQAAAAPAADATPAIAMHEVRAELALASVAEHRGRWRKHRPSMLSYLVLGIGRSLPKHPDLLGRGERAELGLLVQTEQGPHLSVIEDVHTKPLLALEGELRTIHAAAQPRPVSPRAPRVILDARPGAGEPWRDPALTGAVAIIRPGAEWWAEAEVDAPVVSVHIQGHAHDRPSKDELQRLGTSLENQFRDLLP